MAFPCLAQWSGEQEVLAMLPRSAWRRLRGLKHCVKDRAEVRGAFDLNLTGVFFEKCCVHIPVAAF